MPKPLVGASRHFDFGMVLANGQTLEHRFRVENPGPGTVKFLGAYAHTPCCSDIAPLPKSVPPGGSAEITVHLRAGRDGGSKRVEFDVLTDSELNPVLGFSLGVKLVPALEVRPSIPGPLEARSGRPATQSFVVITRRSGDVGLDQPTAVNIDAPAKARFAAVGSEETIGTVIEVRRVVEIELPASRMHGMKRADLVLSWDRPRHEQRRTIEWMVLPNVTATPPILVLEQSTHGETACEVTVESTTGQFRVLPLKGKAIRDGFSPPIAISSTHRLSIPVDRSVAGISDIQIHTDHPDQLVVTVGLLVRSVTPESESRKPVS